MSVLHPAIRPIDVSERPDTAGTATLRHPSDELKARLATLLEGAVSKAEGPEAGLALLDELAASTAMQRYPYYHAARGALLAKVGRRDEAASAYREARRWTSNPVEQEHLRRKLGELT